MKDSIKSLDKILDWGKLTKSDNDRMWLKSANEMIKGVLSCWVVF